jgi:hypothetical protein
MPERPFHILQDSGPAEVTALVEGDRVFVSPESLEAATGWTLKPQGFCLDDKCFPLPPENSPVTERGIDIEGFARLTGQPFALNASHGVAAFTTPAAARAETLQSLQAPDFTLPDLNGNPHSLSDYRGKKILLAAFASW